MKEETKKKETKKPELKLVKKVEEKKEKAKPTHLQEDEKWKMRALVTAQESISVKMELLKSQSLLLQSEKKELDKLLLVIFNFFKKK